jgi:hypothetical protein
MAAHRHCPVARRSSRIDGSAFSVTTLSRRSPVCSFTDRSAALPCRRSPPRCPADCSATPSLLSWISPLPAARGGERSACWPTPAAGAGAGAGRRCVRRCRGGTRATAATASSAPATAAMASDGDVDPLHDGRGLRRLADSRTGAPGSGVRVGSGRHRGPARRHRVRRGPELDGGSHAHQRAGPIRGASASRCRYRRGVH